MRALVVVVALAGLVGTSARAQSFNPNWVNKPKGEDLMAAWPVKAMQREIEGSATLRCDVNVIGGLESCKVESETPAGEGFGAAALLLAPSFQMKPRIDRGKPVRGEVLIPIQFKFPDEAATGTGRRFLRAPSARRS